MELESNREKPRKKDECIIVNDSGTSLNETCLNVKEARELDTLLSSISGWHISHPCKEKTHEAEQKIKSLKESEDSHAKMSLVENISLNQTGGLIC